MTRWFGVLAAFGFLVACGDDDPAPAPPSDHADVAQAGEITGDTGAQSGDPGTELPEEPGLDANFGTVENGGHLDCEGLNSAHCLLPYPSDYFRADGHLAFGETTLPTSTNGHNLGPQSFAGRDGFSVVTPLLFRFPGAVLDGAPSVTDIAVSLEATSKTVIIDTTTGEQVAHWLEIDHFTQGDDSEVLTVRFPKRLAFGRRYVVGVRGLLDADGEPIAADPGFAALRDQSASTVLGVHGRRGRFESEVFDVLTAAGVERAELQLAWDFTTSTQGDHTHRLHAVRAALLEALGDGGPAYQIDSVEPLTGHPHLASMVKATVFVPSFLLPETPDGIRRLRTDPEGNPVIEGTEAVAIELQIPHSAAAAGGPVAVMQYGHGLFGSKNEAHNGWLQAFANRKGFVVVAADMQGMSEVDIGIWGVVLTADVSAFPAVAEKPLQGFVNHLAIARLMKREWNDADGLLFEADPDRIVYYGNSQGGTIGAILMSIHTDIQRGVLGVPGGAYAFLLNRSSTFTAFSGILAIPFPDPVDFAAVLALMQTGFDHMDPFSYLQHVTAEPLEGSPAHRVLLHVAKEDASVHNDVSFLLGRSIEARLMTPTPRPLFGFESAVYPFEGNALVEYDFNKPDAPDPTAPPPLEHDTHGDLRKLEIAQDQLWHFLMTGETISVCEGACDPD